jgi:hypothetical protein
MCSPRALPAIPNDVDVFPYASTLAQSYAAYAALKWAFAKLGLVVVYESSRSITYARPKLGPFSRCPRVQLVKPNPQGVVRTSGTVSEVLSSCDFTVCAALLDRRGRFAEVHRDFVQDESLLRLRVINGADPTELASRMLKYSAKGYRVSWHTLIGVFASWDGLDASQKERLMRKRLGNRDRTLQTGGGSTGATERRRVKMNVRREATRRSS